MEKSWVRGLIERIVALAVGAVFLAIGLLLLTTETLSDMRQRAAATLLAAAGIIILLASLRLISRLFRHGGGEFPFWP